MEKLVLIATYNESESIAALIDCIIEAESEAHILVVDDNSPDKTGEIVEQLAAKDSRVHLLSRTGLRGYGRALLDGFSWALENKAKLIVTLDADFSHDPAVLPNFFEALQGGSDMVLGSRYKDGVRVLNWELRRLCLSVLANTYARLLLRLPFSDCTSGYRGYRRHVLEKILSLNLTSRGYSFLVELLFWMHASKFRIVEAPIIFSERRRGQSKMSKLIIFEALLRPFAVWMSYLFGRR